MGHLNETKLYRCYPCRNLKLGVDMWCDDWCLDCYKEWLTDKKYGNPKSRFSWFAKGKGNYYHKGE